MPQHQPDQPVDSTSEPLGRRQRKALAVRRALLDAGLALFGRQPTATVSVLDITEEADVAKGVFYLHFKSKDEFLIALWEDVCQALLDSVREATTGARSFKGRLECAARQYRHFAETRWNAARFWVRMSGYLPDEIGPPGQLTQLRRELFVRLATLLGVVAADSVTARLLATAEVVDCFCWALIAQSINLERDLPAEALFTRVAVKAAQAAPPPRT